MKPKGKILKRSDAKEWLNKANTLLTEAWRESDKDILLILKEDSETRRAKQNRLLWRWHGELALHIERVQGETYESEDMHEHVVEKLLPKKVLMIDDDPIIVRARTSKLNVKPFADFLTRYEMWAAEKYECLFTRPDELYMQAIVKGES